jgi:hypothetical protein
MNIEGETIIEEYLVLVREKLPDSIADDVISELRSYMHESARDQGDGEITVQSAKKVVAQFGAPGEVADEYRYSMFPETIPDEVVPKEITEEPQHITQQEPAQQVRPQLTPLSQEDPSVSYTSFFLTTSLQSWIWIVIVSLFTLIIGPIGTPLWTLLIPISQAALVTCALLFHSNNLKWNRTILWRRAYREWSSLQNYVTLPENSVPEMGVNILRLDALISFVGIILFLIASILGNSPFFLLLCGVPVCILLGARIYYRAVTFRDDKDPIRNSRKQFVINLALLVGLNASIFWIFYNWGYYGFILTSFSPFLLPFTLGYGSVVLLNIVTGTQNLWWKTQDEPKEIPTAKEKIPDEKKAELLAHLPRTIGKLYAKAALWIFVYNLPEIFVSFDYYATFGFGPSDLFSWIGLFPLGIVVAGIMLAFYFASRRFLIKSQGSTTILGRRTRIEAAVDSIISLFFFVIIIPLILISVLNINIFNEILIYQRHLGITWGIILELMQIVSFPLMAFGLLFRIIGDILEFRPSGKRRAIGLVEQSGVLLVLGMSVFSGSEFLYYVASFHYYYSFSVPYLILLPIVLFLSFQIGSSSLKAKISKGNRENHGGKSIKSNNVYSRIAN